MFERCEPETSVLDKVGGFAWCKWLAKGSGREGRELTEGRREECRWEEGRRRTTWLAAQGSGSVGLLSSFISLLSTARTEDCRWRLWSSSVPTLEPALTQASSATRRFHPAFPPS